MFYKRHNNTINPSIYQSINLSILSIFSICLSFFLLFYLSVNLQDKLLGELNSDGNVRLGELEVTLDAFNTIQARGWAEIAANKVHGG